MKEKMRYFLLNLPFFRYTPIGKRWLREDEDEVTQRLNEIRRSRFKFTSIYADSDRGFRGAKSYFLVNREGRPEQFVYYIGMATPVPIDPTCYQYCFRDTSEYFNKERFVLLFNLCKQFDKQQVTFSVRGADSINTLLMDDENLAEAVLTYIDPRTRERVEIKL